MSATLSGQAWTRNLKKYTAAGTGIRTQVIDPRQRQVMEPSLEALTDSVTKRLNLPEIFPGGGQNDEMPILQQKLSITGLILQNLLPC